MNPKHDNPVVINEEEKASAPQQERDDAIKENSNYEDNLDGSKLSSNKVEKEDENGGDNNGNGRANGHGEDNGNGKDNGNSVKLYKPFKQYETNLLSIAYGLY